MKNLLFSLIIVISILLSSFGILYLPISSLSEGQIDVSISAVKSVEKTLRDYYIRYGYYPLDMLGYMNTPIVIRNQIGGGTIFFIGNLPVLPLSIVHIYNTNVNKQPTGIALAWMFPKKEEQLAMLAISLAVSRGYTPKTLTPRAFQNTLLELSNMVAIEDLVKNNCGIGRPAIILTMNKDQSEINVCK